MIIFNVLKTKHVKHEKRSLLFLNDSGKSAQRMNLSGKVNLITAKEKSHFERSSSQKDFSS